MSNSSFEDLVRPSYQPHFTNSTRANETLHSPHEVQMLLSVV